MIAECTAIVLAGGDSRRMGRDKATLPLDGKTLLERVLATVQPLFADVRVSVRRPRPEIDWPQIIDPRPDAGPLAGLCAGLEHADANKVPWIFLVATDMPFLQPELIEQLAQKRAGVQAVVPRIHGETQPLAAFYSTQGLGTIRALLDDTGRPGLRAALERLHVCHVDEAELQADDPGLHSFFDLDTPQDLAAARNQGKPTP